MEILLLGIYSFFVWLIFIKFKWLPWNTTSQVTVAIIPIVALTALILVLNVVAPSSADVRVFKYTVPIVSQASWSSSPSASYPQRARPEGADRMRRRVRNLR